MSHKQESRAQWSSSLGFILATAGSAVGLGNIWKFPGKAYEGGGAGFILIYILITFTIGVTVMLTEFAVGRNTKKNAVGAFKKLNSKWRWVGGLGILTAFLISSYYLQVGGWVIQYIFGYTFQPQAIYADPQGYFLNMLGSNGFPWLGAIVFPSIFIIITAFILLKGVEKGIEKISKILMPILLFLLFALMIRSVTMEGAEQGVKYLLHFDLSSISLNTFMLALGQAFFSLSLGMGIICTYGSYLKKDENLVKNTGIICAIDTIVAITAAFAIIPAVFASGIAPGAGGSFAFVSLSTVFKQMPWGNLFAISFYVLLLFAALTSSISIIEGIVAYITEEKKLSRKTTIISLSLVLFFIGVFYTLSQTYTTIECFWLDGKNGLYLISFGDFLEYLTDRLLGPIGSLSFCIFVGWIWGARNAIAEVRQQGKFKFILAPAWSFTVKYIAPLAISSIIISSLFFGKGLS